MKYNGEVMIDIISVPFPKLLNSFAEVVSFRMITLGLRTASNVKYPSSDVEHPIGPQHPQIPDEWPARWRVRPRWCEIPGSC